MMRLVFPRWFPIALVSVLGSLSLGCADDETSPSPTIFDRRPLTLTTSATGATASVDVDWLPPGGTKPDDTVIVVRVPNAGQTIIDYKATWTCADSDGAKAIVAGPFDNSVQALAYCAPSSRPVPLRSIGLQLEGTDATTLASLPQNGVILLANRAGLSAMLDA